MILSILINEVVEYGGLGRNYIGYSQDADIYAELQNRWNSFVLLDEETLTEIGIKSVTEQITTGYNLYHSNNNANFLAENTLRYGHSDIKHAQLVIALLQSEGINTRVQLEPKVSVYTYLLEWGDPGDPTPQYEVKEVADDLYLAFAVEYDMLLEFETVDEKTSFDKVINEYAKKNSDEEGKALIDGAWWQPLYTSTVEMGEGYSKIYDNLLFNDEYFMRSFSLEADLKDKFSTLAPSLEATQSVVWVDDAFYRYLTGESE